MSKAPAPFSWKRPESLPDDAARITSFYQSPEGGVRQDLAHADLVRAIQSGAGRLWVDVDCHHTESWLALAETVGFHPLTIEDTLSPNSRLKLEEYDSYLFVVA